MFCEKLEKLKTHAFITKQQALFYQNCKENLEYGEALIMADFSENPTFFVQSSPQNVHWNAKQASLHVFVIYYRDINGKLCHFSHIVIAEWKDHDTVSVHLCQKKLMPHLKEKVPGLKKVKFLSDGAVQHYKNKYNFLNLTFFFFDFGIEAEWHYFGSGHGRSSCDGVGGHTKNVMNKESLRRDERGKEINSPKVYYEVAKSKLPSITFDFSTLQEHKIEKRSLQSRFKTAKGLPQTRDTHCIQVVGPGKLRVKTFSLQDESKSRVVNIQ